MALDKLDDIDRLGQEMLTLQAELDEAMQDLPEEKQQELKGPIDQLTIDALLSEKPCADAFLKIIERLRSTVAFLKTDEATQQ